MDKDSDQALVGVLADIVAAVTGLTIDEVRIGGSLRKDLNIDSIGILEVVLAVESRIRVSIPDEEIGQLADRSIQGLADWIRAERG